jgi:septal ring-binding cell division protein DamX
MRNFLYNKSDILAAAVIIIVAIIIIWSRIDAILDSDNVASTKTPAKTTQETGEDAAVDPNLPADDNTVQPSGDDATVNPDEGTATEEPTNTPAAGEVVTFKVKSGMASGQIATALKEAGLIASTEEFNKAINDKNVATKLKAGTFKIPAGSSIDQIVEILTK